MARQENKALAQARPNANVLAPGDVVDVPEQTRQPVSFSPGGTAKYRVRVQKTHVRLKLVQPDGKAIANKRFEVVSSGAKRPVEGRTDGDGVLDALVSVHQTHAQVRVFVDGDEPLEFPVLIGHLDPISEPTGVAGRLRNLGYSVAIGVEGLAAAVAAFQRDQGLPETGQVDDATREALEQHHGV
ncbi:MAG: peptidoglycan-binding domain-containing protein [Polyangiaceae bacterium]